MKCRAISSEEVDPHWVDLFGYCSSGSEMPGLAKRMSTTDAGFLYLERPNASLNIGLVLMVILDLFPWSVSALANV